MMIRGSQLAKCSSLVALSVLLLASARVLVAAQEGTSVAPLANICPSTGVLSLSDTSPAGDRIVTLSSSAIEQSEVRHGMKYARIEGADGTSAWLIDENGVKTVDQGAKHEELITRRAILCNDIEPLENAGTSAFYGRTPNGLNVMVFRDAGGHVAFARYSAANEETHFIQIAYGKTPNGLVYPMSWKSDVGSPFTVVRAALKKNSIKQPLTVPWATTITQGSGSVLLTIRDGLFSVPCELDEIAASCILDTGAGGLLVSSDLAKFDTATVSPVDLNTDQGTIDSQRGRVRSLRVAGSVFTKPVVTEEPRLAPRTVMVGRDYFQVNRVRLVFGTHFTLLNEPQAVECTTGCVPVSIWQVPTGTVTIGNRPLTMLFDTGSGSAVQAPPSFIASKIMKHSAACVDGQSTSVSLGGLAVDADLCPMQGRTGYLFSVGAPLLMKFRAVVIDYPNHRFQFIK